MPTRPPRRPPVITGSALEKSALFYLERYATSSGQLRRVLLRRVKRAEMLGAEAAQVESARRQIQALIERYLASGLLDDRRFAESQAQSLQRRGHSRRRIRQRLAAKGVERNFVEDALETIEPEGESSEIAAACVLARRRRLGRSAEVTAEVSHVATLGQVRDYVNGLLRAAAKDGGVVMDGRDIGTVVFPDAEVKVFMVAESEERARRRLLEQGEKADRRSVERERGSLEARDARDSNRDVAPLAMAPGAVLIDTTRLGFEEQVRQVVELAKKAGGA